MDDALPFATLALVAVVFVSAVRAIRRDRRIDQFEIFIQLVCVAAYLAGCVGLAMLLVPLSRRIGIAAAAVLGFASIAVSMVVLARYLQRRLARRSVGKR